MEECKQQNHQTMAIAYDPSTVHQILSIGTKKEILEILKDEIDSNSTSGNGDTVLHSVLKNDNLTERDIVEILSLLITQFNVDPNIMNKYEQTVLHLSIEKRMKSTVDLLFKFEADFKVVDKHGNSIAHFFIEDEYKKCVLKKYNYLFDAVEYRAQIENDGISFLHFLISKDVDFDSQNNQGMSALELAIKHQLSYLLPTILDSSVAILADNKYGCEMISKAIREKKKTSVIETLIGFYLKYCDDRNLATTLFYELIDNCKLWSSSLERTDYYLTVLRDLRAFGVNINNEPSQKKLEFTAAEAENSRLIDFLKESGVNFSIEQRREKNVLHMLAEQRYYEGPTSELCKLICDLVVCDNCQIDSQDEQGKTPLQSAAGNGHIKMVEVLINLGAYVNCRDQHMCTPLHEALMSNVSAEVVELLISNGADLTATDSRGETPLHLAVSNSNIVQLLLAYGAPVNCKNEFEQTPLHRAVMNDKADQVVDLLLTNGADPNAKDRRGDTPLHFAISSNNPKVTLALLLKNASVNCKNDCQQTPLHRAVMNDNAEEIVNLLLSCGAEIDAKDFKGETPLHLVVCNNNLSIVQLLITNGASVNCKDDRLQTPLHRAVEMDETVEVIELLLTCGADVNARDSKGNKPLHMIFNRWSVDNYQYVLEMLLENGAYVNAQNNAGESALFSALSFKNHIAINELLKYGAYVNDPCVRKLVCQAYTMKDLVFFQKHLMKLKVANLPLDEEYGVYINNNASNVEPQFNEECLKEIKRLENFSIDKHQSLLDFLHMNPKRRGAYLNHVELLKLKESPASLREQFPQYSVVILASYREAMTKKLLLKAAEEALYMLIQPRLPVCVAVQILAHLNDVDMINVIDANDTVEDDL